MCGYTRLDRLRNKMIRETIGVRPIEDNLRESRLRWFSHVKRGSVDELVRMCESMDLPDCR